MSNANVKTVNTVDTTTDTDENVKTVNTVDTTTDTTDTDTNVKTVNTVKTVKNANDNVPRIPIKMIDYHTRVCSACEQRRNFMETIYKIPMDPEKNCDEFMARDEMLDNIILECRKCFVRSVENDQKDQNN
jgi:hypothetical protein